MKILNFKEFLIDSINKNKFIAINNRFKNEFLNYLEKIKFLVKNNNWKNVKDELENLLKILKDLE